RLTNEPRRESRKLPDEFVVTNLILLIWVPCRVRIRHRRKTHYSLSASFQRASIHRGDLEAVNTVRIHPTLTSKPYLINKRPRLFIAKRHIARGPKSPRQKKLAGRMSERSSPDIQKNAPAPCRSRQYDPLKDRVWEPPRSILLGELPPATHNQK